MGSVDTSNPAASLPTVPPPPPPCPRSCRAPRPHRDASCLRVPRGTAAWGTRPHRGARGPRAGRGDSLKGGKEAGRRGGGWRPGRAQDRRTGERVTKAWARNLTRRARGRGSPWFTRSTSSRRWWQHWRRGWTSPVLVLRSCLPPAAGFTNSAACGRLSSLHFPDARTTEASGERRGRRRGDRRRRRERERSEGKGGSAMAIVIDNG